MPNDMQFDSKEFKRGNKGAQNALQERPIRQRILRIQGRGQGNQERVPERDEEAVSKQPSPQFAWLEKPSPMRWGRVVIFLRF